MDIATSSTARAGWKIPEFSMGTASLAAITLGLAGLLLLTGLAASSRAPLVYDEPFYLKPVELIEREGLTLEFLRDYPEPAGLLHNVLHWALSPLTGLKPPLVRLVNPALLTITIAFTFLTLQRLGSTKPMACSVAIMDVPFIWVMSGLVLTEMPSIALVSLSIYLLLRSLPSTDEQSGYAVLTALLGGVALGLAFLSRASVLVVLGAVPCLVLSNRQKTLRIAVAFELGALLIAGPVIAFWGGLVPPHSAVVVGTSSISIYNMSLSFAYAATVMLLLAPRWFDLPSRVMVAIAASIVLANVLTGSLEIPVAKAVVASLPPIVGLLVPRLAGSAMAALAVLFAISSARHLYTRRLDPTWLFLCVAMLLVIASPAKVTHQFSSRYTGMAAALMVLASEPFATVGRGQMVRQLIGMAIGLSSLLSYYAVASK